MQKNDGRMSVQEEKKLYIKKCSMRHINYGHRTLPKLTVIEGHEARSRGIPSINVETGVERTFLACQYSTT